MKLMFLITISTSLQVGTTRVIYAWNEADPAGNDPNAVLNHGTRNRGTQSLNLLGGQQEVPSDPADLETFDVAVQNVCFSWESMMCVFLSVTS